MIATVNNIHRGLAPTALFNTKDTAYGVTYLPANELAKQCTNLAGVFELNTDQRRIVESMGINFEVRS